MAAEVSGRDEPLARPRTRRAARPYLRPKSTPNTVEIIAHRGASFDAPENTMAAVNLAWAQGADAVEIDVQMSSEGRVVVIHDERTKKTAGVDRRVCDQSYDDLCLLDVGRWKDAKWTGERIPALSAILKSVPASKRLFIEVKCEARGLADLARTIEQSGSSPSQVVLIGFCRDAMAKAKVRLPQLEVGWVVKCQRNWKSGRWSPTISELVDEARRANLDALDLGANRPLTRAEVEQIKQAGLKVYIWTVDSPAKARRLMQAGVDGLTTNRPGWLREQLQDLI